MQIFSDPYFLAHISLESKAQIKRIVDPLSGSIIYLRKELRKVFGRGNPEEIRLCLSRLDSLGQKKISGDMETCRMITDEIKKIRRKSGDEAGDKVLALCSEFNIRVKGADSKKELFYKAYENGEVESLIELVYEIGVRKINGEDSYTKIANDCLVKHRENKNYNIALDMAIASLELGIKYEDYANRPLTTERLICDSDDFSPSKAVTLANLALTNGLKLKPETLEILLRRNISKCPREVLTLLNTCIVKKIPLDTRTVENITIRAGEQSENADDIRAYVDSIRTAIDQGVMDPKSERATKFFNVVLARLGDPTGERFFENATSSELFEMANSGANILVELMDRRVRFDQESNIGRVNLFLRGMKTISEKLLRDSEQFNQCSNGQCSAMGIDFNKDANILLKRFLELMSKALTKSNNQSLPMFQIKGATINTVLSSIGTNSGYKIDNKTCFLIEDLLEKAYDIKSIKVHLMGKTLDILVQRLLNEDCARAPITALEIVKKTLVNGQPINGRTVNHLLSVLKSKYSLDELMIFNKDEFFHDWDLIKELSEKKQNRRLNEPSGVNGHHSENNGHTTVWNNYYVGGQRLLEITLNGEVNGHRNFLKLGEGIFPPEIILDYINRGVLEIQEESSNNEFTIYSVASQS